MKKLILTVLVVAALAFYAGLTMGSNPESFEEVATDVSSSKNISLYDSGPPEARELLELVNEARQKGGIAPLVNAAALEASACAKNTDMIADMYWSHNSPDGLAPWSFIIDQGYTYRSASENLAVSPLQSTSRSVFDAWMASDGHREGIMRAETTQTGICVTQVEDFLEYGDSYLSTQHFAQPY